MEYSTLDKLGVRVSRLGFGCMRFPLTAEGKIDEPRAALKQRVFVGCTGCKYCMPCPFGVDIPRNFKLMNDYEMYSNERALKSGWNFIDEGARATACKKCGKCERACPQRLPIRQKLAEIAERMN